MLPVDYDKNRRIHNSGYNAVYVMGATSGAGTAYPPGAPEFTPGF
jgi:hypothetical protein